MANLSDLWRDETPHPVPGWIAALGQPHGFRDEVRAPTVPEPVAEPDEQDTVAAALAEAYARGAEDARVQCREEQEAAAAAQGRLALAFARLDAEAALALRQALATAVATLCEQVIEPARIDRAALEQRCADLATQLGEAAAPLALQLHPDDLALLSAETVAGWTIRPDPGLPRGALRLEGPDGVFADGPEEWRRLIAEALGQ